MTSTTDPTRPTSLRRPVARGVPPKPTVSVVIPALNEGRNIRHVLEQLPDDVAEVVLVDGRSTDDTVEVARRVRPDVRVIQQSRQGKGNALACGFHACRGDIAVMLDADGSTSPLEIPAFVDALLSGAHVAKGTRFALGGGSGDITRLRALGNALLNQLVNKRYGTGYTDLCYGYNAFWRECLAPLGVSEPGTEVLPGDPPRPRAVPPEPRWGDGFEIETLLTVRVAMLGMIVTEVGSFESTRLHGRSNLHAVRDGWRVLHTIAAERRQFAPRARVAPPLTRPWDAFAIDLRDPEDVPDVAPVATPGATPGVVADAALDVLYEAG